VLSAFQKGNTVHNVDIKIPLLCSSCRIKTKNQLHERIGGRKISKRTSQVIIRLLTFDMNLHHIALNIERLTSVNSKKRLFVLK
jgi:hypothetical protein